MHVTSFTRFFFALTLGLVTHFGHASGSTISACPFSAAEIESALGIKYRWMPPAETSADGARTLVCRGIGDGNDSYLFINQYVLDPKTPNLKTRLSARLRAELAKSEPVPGDPDGALFQPAGEIASYRLGYVRGHVMTTLTIMSPPKAVSSGLKDRMLKLKRVP